MGRSVSCPEYRCKEGVIPVDNQTIRCKVCDGSGIVGEEDLKKRTEYYEKKMELNTKIISEIKNAIAKNM